MVKKLPDCLLLFLLLCTAFPCAAASPPLVLPSSTASARLSGHIDILEDKTGTLTINEVNSPETAKLFKPDTRAVPNFGMTTSVYWVRFMIENEAEAEKRWLLELDFPHMDYLDLYVPSEGGGFDRMQAGDMRPMSIRKFRHRNPVFPVVIGTQGTTLYLRVDGGGRTIMPLTVWSPEAFSRMDHRRGLIDGGYFGAMLVMIAYNFFIFLSLRDRNYLYYILDILFVALFVFFSKGFLIEFISAEMPSINKYSFLLNMSALFAGLLFCRNFLATARNAPFIDRIIKILMLVSVLSIPAFFIVSPEAWKSAMAVVTACASATGMIAGVVCLRRGYHPARYYVGARIFRVLGVFTVVLGMHNILPLNLLTSFGLQIGSLFEVVLLSFALADRINIMRREKEKAETEACSSSSRALIGEMAAGVAHEVNNPLAGVMLCFQGIITSKEGDPVREELIKAVETGLVKIQTTVAHLLNFSRMSATETKPTDIGKLVGDVLMLCKYQLEKLNIEVVTNLAANLPSQLLDENKIGQVLANLIFNASHAMGEGGRLTISTVREGEWCVLCVADTGKGIAPDVLPRIFEPFFTTMEVGKGTGLGLSMSKSIVEAHGGSINMESTQGVGSTCRIRLPLEV